MYKSDALYADDTCTYATDRKERYILRKLQSGLTATEAWCERWNINTNEGKTLAIYFSPRRGQIQSSYIERTEHPLCKGCKISRCDFL
jgi:hypothetical protein